MFWYNKTAKSLPKLQVGQGVRMQPVEHSGQWRKATIIKKVGECSYLAQTEGNVYQRNKKFLKATAHTEKGKEPNTTPISGKVEAPPSNPITDTETPNPSTSNSQQNSLLDDHGYSSNS